MLSQLFWVGLDLRLLHWWASRCLFCSVELVSPALMLLLLTSFAVVEKTGGCGSHPNEALASLAHASFSTVALEDCTGSGMALRTCMQR